MTIMEIAKKNPSCFSHMNIAVDVRLKYCILLFKNVFQSHHTTYHS